MQEEIRARVMMPSTEQSYEDLTPRFLKQVEKAGVQRAPPHVQSLYQCVRGQPSVMAHIQMKEGERASAEDAVAALVLGIGDVHASMLLEPLDSMDPEVAYACQAGIFTMAPAGLQAASTPALSAALGRQRALGDAWAANKLPARASGPVHVQTVPDVFLQERGPSADMASVRAASREATGRAAARREAAGRGASSVSALYKVLHDPVAYAELLSRVPASPLYPTQRKLQAQAAAAARAVAIAAQTGETC